jgi:nucleoid-associated protein YgaU
MTNRRSYLPTSDASATWPALPVAAGAEWLAATAMAPATRRARHLRLVGDVGDVGDGDAAVRPSPVGGRADVVAPRARPHRRASVAVRRRRLLLGVAVSALVLLALPLRATGGTLSGSASAPGSLGAHGPATYVVRPGDTLWSIAERVDPSADPRPLVVRLAAQVGSDTIVPGEQLRLP